MKGNSSDIKMNNNNNNNNNNDDDDNCFKRLDNVQMIVKNA